MKLNYSTFGYQGLSYSRKKDFTTCPRMFQINHALGLARRRETVTFSFGHAVAAGVQEWFNSQNEDLCYLQCVRHYNMDWDDLGTPKEQKDKKSLWTALYAVEHFLRLLKSSIAGDMAEFRDYEVLEVMSNGKPLRSVELEFRIQLEHGFVYEGHVDLILRHKNTGEIIVLELKTTNLKDPHPAIYQNSDQALGYSIVVDKIADLLGDSHVASYRVIYLVWSSSAQDWVIFKFPKSAKQRINWLNNLVRDVDLIYSYQLAAEQGVPYPTRGDSCLQFFRPCDYLNLCGYEDETLIQLLRPATKADEQFEEKDQAHFIFTLDEVVNMQIALSESRLNINLGHASGHLDLTI